MDLMLPNNNHDKIQLVHDALAECKNSDELYLLIHEHYQDACCNNPCSHGFNVCARLIGSLVIDAIRAYDRKRNEQMQGDEAENAAACAADDQYHERLERGEV